MRPRDLTCLIPALTALACGQAKLGLESPSAEAPPEFAAHDPHAPTNFAVPPDYSSAVPWVRERVAAVQAAVRSGRPHDAHEPLDELTVVLFRLPYLARDSEVPKSHWETINTSARALRRALDHVHEHIDAEEAVPPSLLAVLDEPLSRLQAVAAATEAAPPPAPSSQASR
jgi:hypothetical protein